MQQCCTHSILVRENQRQPFNSTKNMHGTGGCKLCTSFDRGIDSDSKQLSAVFRSDCRRDSSFALKSTRTVERGQYVISRETGQRCRGGAPTLTCPARGSLVLVGVIVTKSLLYSSPTLALPVLSIVTSSPQRISSGSYYHGVCTTCCPSRLET